MITRIFKNQIIYIYLTLWAAVTVVHFLLLNQAYKINIVNAAIDSLVFNLIFCILGIGIWFMAEFSGNQESNITENIIRHATLGSLTIVVWIGLSRFLIKSFLSDQSVYIEFLENSLMVRVFTGLMF